MTNKIKENWNAKDEKCPACGQVTNKAIGLNKQNLKKLCWSKPTLQDVIIFIMLIVFLIMAWSYNNEITQYKNMVNNPEGFCIRYYNDIIAESIYSFDVNQLENNKILSDLNESMLNISVKNG